MNTTNVLLSIIIAILVAQFYPGLFNVVAVVGTAAAILYGTYWMIARYPAHRKREHAVRQQREADDTEYWGYRSKADAIRKKYDPRDEWNEATQVPEEYLKELHSLHLAHEAMLRRRNGFTDADFFPRH